MTTQLDNLLDAFTERGLYLIYRIARQQSEEGLEMYRTERFRQELKKIINQKIDEVINND